MILKLYNNLVQIHDGDNFEEIKMIESKNYKLQHIIDNGLHQLDILAYDEVIAQISSNNLVIIDNRNML